MEKASKRVAWMCIFSTLLMGCYGTALIDPEGAEKEKIRSGEIEFVIMPDSTKWVFDKSPAVVNDTIVGEVTSKENPYLEVSISLSDVAQVGHTQSGATQYVVTKAGIKYSFVMPPAIVDKAIIGKVRHKASGSWKASIPLSDLRQVGITDYSLGVTLARATVGLCVVIGVVVLIVSSDNIVSPYM